MATKKVKAARAKFARQARAKATPPRSGRRAKGSVVPERKRGK